MKGQPLASQPPIHPDDGISLALAVVASSTAPLLLLDDELAVIAASDSFFATFGLTAGEVIGRPIFDIGAGEWNVRQLRGLLNATASGQAEVAAYEMDLKVPDGARQLVLNAHKLEYGDGDHVRLLLSVADVTDARLATKLKDDLLREKAILLQEVQHRVANSLQIIASVILQSARKVKAEESRAALTDAHNRVMSVATLQQQLAMSQLGEVKLRGYFGQLCESIGASMIRDHNQLSLDVVTDESAVEAEVSVSLGLIVTELVINCLKHAFPGGRKGKILVEYQSHGPNWTLSVRDDGVGMPRDQASITAGLGTSIVEALANQLNARVHANPAHPGTTVSVVHAHIRAVSVAARD